MRLLRWVTIQKFTNNSISASTFFLGVAPARKHLAFQRSKLRYVARTNGAALATALHFFLLLCYAVDWLVEAAKWLIGHKQPLRRQRMQVYGQVLHGISEHRA